MHGSIKLAIWLLLGAIPSIGQNRPAADSTPCPDPAIVAVFKHLIAYDSAVDRTPVRGLRSIDARVWARDGTTVFYLDQPLVADRYSRDYYSRIRLAYVIDERGLQTHLYCPTTQDWRQCVEKELGPAKSTILPRTCALKISATKISRWRPTPDGDVKRKVADELRQEIEARWIGAKGIIVRDFHLQDPQITMLIKMPDGDYFQGCAFRAGERPHCDGWHLFGMTPEAYLRERILEWPLRLK
jgi:hypothetical protein